jgi:putative redox protein
MTLRMFAQRKGWPLDSVRVALVHDKVHAIDCEQCETNTGQIDSIARVIEINGDLNAAQRERLIEIADRCPVHRTLHTEVSVMTRAGVLD